MNCEKCGANCYNIQIYGSCEDCEHDGAWDEEENKYEYDREIIKDKGLIVNQVEVREECRLGVSFGKGCHSFTCLALTCGHITIMPICPEEE